MFRRAVLNVFNNDVTAEFRHIVFRAQNVPILPIGSQITLYLDDISLGPLQIDKYYTDNHTGVKIHLICDAVTDAWEEAWAKASSGQTTDYRTWPTVILFPEYGTEPWKSEPAQ